MEWGTVIRNIISSCRAQIPSRKSNFTESNHLNTEMVIIIRWALECICIIVFSCVTTIAWLVRVAKRKVLFLLVEFHEITVFHFIVKLIQCLQISLICTQHFHNIYLTLRCSKCSHGVHGVQQPGGDFYQPTLAYKGWKKFETFVVR